MNKIHNPTVKKCKRCGGNVRRVRTYYYDKHLRLEKITYERSCDACNSPL